MDCNPNQTWPVFWYYISTYQIWIIDAVFQKLLSGRQILITDGRTHARTGVTLNAPPPFFQWRGHKNYIVAQHNLVFSQSKYHKSICRKHQLLKVCFVSHLLHQLDLASWVFTVCVGCSYNIVAMVSTDAGDRRWSVYAVRSSWQTSSGRHRSHRGYTA